MHNISGKLLEIVLIFFIFTSLETRNLPHFNWVIWLYLRLFACLSICLFSVLLKKNSSDFSGFLRDAKGQITKT